MIKPFIEHTSPLAHYTHKTFFCNQRDRFGKDLAALRWSIGLLIWPVLFVSVSCGPALAQKPAWAQKEVTSDIYRYREQEVIAKYYERHEVRPRTHLPFVARQIPQRELITLAPTAEKVRFRKYLSDSHWGIRFYEWRTCTRCHPRQAHDLHTARYKITCRQCHGGEPIAGIRHYYSPMHPRKRYTSVCAKCHKGSSASFATYVVHEPNPIAMGTQESFPALFYVFWLMVAIAAGTFLVFLPHTFMWGLREFWSIGAVKTSKVHRIKRFTPAQRLFHLLLMLSFTTQAATGLARMYIGTSWGRFLASLFGGYEQTLIIHWRVGLFLLILLGVHVLYVLSRIDWRRFPRSVYGPDSLLPRIEDLGQALQHVGWILGLSKPPRFDRWGYWEKFDYWAVFWGISILGGTGLILYNPTNSSLYMPGWMLNVLLWVHRIEAVLAIAHVTIIHFFIGHIRRHNFPMDLVMFEGSVDLEKTRHERPAWVERLEQQNALEGLITKSPPVSIRVVYYAFGFVMIIGCFYLLINGLVAGIGLLR